MAIFSLCVRSEYLIAIMYILSFVCHLIKINES